VDLTAFALAAVVEEVVFLAAGVALAAVLLLAAGAVFFAFVAVAYHKQVKHTLRKVLLEGTRCESLLCESQRRLTVVFLAAALGAALAEVAALFLAGAAALADLAGAVAAAYEHISGCNHSKGKE